MADNVIITQGTGTAIAAENIAGAYIQRIKLALGDLDADAGDVAIDNPMPIIATGGTTNIGNTVTVSVGNSPAVTVTSGNITVSGGNIVVSGTVNQTGSVTSSGTTNIGNVVVVSGSVNIGNNITIAGGNIVVSGTVNSTTTATLSGGTVNINSPSGGLLVSGTVNSTTTATLTGGTVNIGNPITLISNTTNANVNQIGGNTLATSVGATGSGVQRVVLADNMGRTLLTVSGTTLVTGTNNMVIPASASNKNKVYAYSVTSLCSQQANLIFTDGSLGNPLCQYVLNGGGNTTGANLAVTPPAFLFANSAVNTPIFLQVAGGTNPVSYYCAYWQDAT